MDREQKKALVEAWALHNKILRDIQTLATAHESLAYGCIRTAETIIDGMMVDKLRGARRKEATHEERKGEG